MGKLENTVGLLSGPIDFAEDDGIGFRRKIRTHAAHFNVRCRWLDPTEKPVGMTSEIGEEKKLLNQLINDGKWAELSKHCRDFVLQDERMVDMSDFIVGYIDRTIHMCGTYDEIFRAQAQNKPVYLIVAGGKKNCPRWIFGKFDYREIFDSIEHLIKHLVSLDKGVIPLDHRWILMRDELSKPAETPAIVGEGPSFWDQLTL